MENLDISKFGLCALEAQVTSPLMHLGSNSLAAVRHEIRKQERVHWTSGLRQAELTIREKSDSLYQSQIQVRECSRKLRLLKHEYDEIKSQVSNTLSVPDEIRLEEIEDKVVAAQRDWYNIQPLLRDAQMELEAAKQEKERILKSHPEATYLSYQELQEIYTEPALISKLASYFAAEAWASMNRLPSSVGHLTLDISPDKRELLMQMEAEIRTGVSLDEATIQAARRIVSLPPEKQEEVINMLMPSQN